MEKIVFFDLSIGGRNRIHDGRDISVADLVKLRLDQDPEIFRAKNFVSDMNAYSFDLFKRSKKWNRAVATMVFCLSGQVPSRQEITEGRTLIENLPKEFKRRAVDRRFVLAFLPYLMSGFRLGPARYQENANSAADMAETVMRLFDPNCRELWTFLCSHREAEIIEPYSLVKKLDFNKLGRALNLSMGLAANSLPRPRKIVWLQQFATARASSSLFPEVFLRYLRRGCVPDLLVLLKRHARQIRSYFALKRTPFIDLELKSLDKYTNEIGSLLSGAYGPDWRAGQNVHLCDVDPVIRRLASSALPDIKRFMPYFGLSRREQAALMDVEAIDRNHQRALQLEKRKFGQGLARLTEESIGWFIQNQRMHISAKALYEAMFYFCCGLKTAAGRSVYLGLERDHSRFQAEALREGYMRGLGGSRLRFSGFPIIFARHNYKEVPGGGLAGISFRQFWRLNQQKANILQGGKKWEDMEESRNRSVWE